MARKWEFFFFLGTKHKSDIEIHKYRQTNRIKGKLVEIKVTWKIHLHSGVLLTFGLYDFATCSTFVKTALTKILQLYKLSI